MMSVFSNNNLCFSDYLGIVPYEDALKLQQALVEARVDGKIPDVLLLLQHPPVFTIGRFRGGEDIITSAETLAQEGIAVFPSNRGGSVTYHGPGQLVGYPILNLKGNGLGVLEYIRKLEEVVIKVLLAFGIQGERVAKYPGGVWVGGEKICSVGIHVSHYVTMHGFALNVNTNLRHFEYINPCGIKGAAMTSISKLLEYPVKVEAVIPSLLDTFSETFELKCERGLEKCLNMLGALSG